jgi:hypothetical protein
MPTNFTILGKGIELGGRTRQPVYGTRDGYRKKGAGVVVFASFSRIRLLAKKQ